jgi:tetratricopeptide (TPR) repeat protein
MGRFGSREKALQLMRNGIAALEALAATKDPGLVREWLAAEGRLGELDLMDGEIDPALSHFRHSRIQFERLAKLDPEDKMLQSDLWVAKFVEARAIAVSGRYPEALPLLRAAYRGYMGLHLDYDVGPGRGAMQAWIAEAQSATGDYAGAASSYENAAKSLTEDLGSYDDARCDLAMVQAKRGSVLTRAGRFQEAREEFSKALATADLQPSIQRMDTPAIYAAAETYAGLGELDVTEAETVKRSEDKFRLISAARVSYERSLKVRSLIPNPSRYDSNGYLVRDLGDLNRRLSAITQQKVGQAGPK